MDKLFIFIRIIFAERRRSIAFHASFPRRTGPLLIALLNRISPANRPQWRSSLTLMLSRVFSAASAQLSFAAERGPGRILITDFRLSSDAAASPRCSAAFSVRRRSFCSTKMPCQLERRRRCRYFYCQPRISAPDSTSGVSRFQRGSRLLVSQRRVSGGILLMGGPVAPANQRANP